MHVDDPSKAINRNEILLQFIMTKGTPEKKKGNNHNHGKYKKIRKKQQVVKSVMYEIGIIDTLRSLIPLTPPERIQKKRTKGRNCNGRIQ